MENFLIITILVLLVGGAVFYIRKARKKGVKCIGCPHSGPCSRCSCDDCNT